MKYGVIENGKCINVIEAESPDIFPRKTLVEIPLGFGKGDLCDGEVWSKTAEDISSLKDDIRSAIETARITHTAGGYRYNFPDGPGTVQTRDEVDLRNIQGIGSTGTAMKASGVTHMVQFDQGLMEISAGETLTGDTATATVFSVSLEFGSWEWGNAAGVLYLSNVDGAGFVSGGDLVSDAGSAYAASSSQTARIFFKDEENTVHYMTPDQAIAFGFSATLWVSKNYKAAWTHKAAVDALGSIEDIQEYSIAGGWPA